MSKLNWLRSALFWHCQLSPSASLATDLSLHDARPVGLGRAQILPRWLLRDTDSRIVKDRTGARSRQAAPPIQYDAEPGHRSGQVKLLFPNAAPPLTTLSESE